MGIASHDDRVVGAPLARVLPLDAAEECDDLGLVGVPVRDLLDQAAPLGLRRLVGGDRALFVRAKVTKKQEHVDQLAAPLILTQDILRGLIAGERELSPVTLAALARIALEVHVNLRFITKGPDPAKYADRYSRYGEVEKLIHDRRRGPSEPFMVSPALEAAIRSKCP